MAIYSIGHSSGQAVIFNKNADTALYTIHKNTIRVHFHTLKQQHLQLLKISKNLIKNFIEVNRSLLIRISEFPVNMHNFRPI